MADKSTTITKLETTHSPVPNGQGFAITAYVAWAGPNHVHGDVEFFADGESIATHRTDKNGVATTSIAGGLMKAGEHAFTATFHGDGYNDASTSEPLVVMLVPADGEPWPGEDIDTPTQAVTTTVPVQPTPVVPPPVVPLSPMEPPARTP